MPKIKKASEPRHLGSPRRKAALVLVVLGAVIVIAFWPRSRRPATTAVAGGADTETATQELQVDSQRSAISAPPSLRRAARSEQDPPPVIDEIQLEKQEVCEGEENLVTVRAHTTNGTNEYLHTTIDGKLGSSVPVRLMLEGDHVAGKHFISVFGRGNVATTVPLPTYRVKDCQEPYMASVTVGQQPNSWFDYDFVVRVQPFAILGKKRPAANPFVPARFEWVFGDGETATTTVPTVSHNYEGRSQETQYSYMNISVEAVGQDGTRVKARTSLALRNIAFDALHNKGLVQLFVALDPQFPVLDERGQVEQHVRIWHTASEPVQIERVGVTDYYQGAAGQSPEKVVDAASVLGTTTIPPGKEGITATVVLDTVADPRVFTRTYRLTGKTAQYVAKGNFSVMRPPPTPTASNSTPVTDPNLKAKILATRRILQKDVVNDRDIRQLELAGKLAYLETAAAAPSPASPPATPTGATK